MQVWNVLHVARWKCRMQIIAIWSPSHNFVGLYLPNEGTYRQSEKKLIKQQYFLHMSLQYGKLRPTSSWDRFVSLGHPSYFQCFGVLASLLQRRRSTEANQTLHGVWLFPGLMHYIYIFGGSCPVTEFCQVQNSLCILQVLRSRILVALLLEQWARAKLCGIEHRAPPIFGRATITLGIGPHASYSCCCCC